MADNEIRIKDLTEATSLASGDNFVIDNANSRGTKRFPYSEFLKLVPVIFNEWTAMVGYGQSAIVTHEGKLYRNKKDYTVISTTWQGSSIWEEIKLDSILDDIVANFVSWYDEDTTYSVNDYAIHQYDLYRCTTAGATGTWDSTKWVKTDVISFIKNIVMSNFSAKRITPGYAESVSKGEVYIIKNLMYRAKEDTTTDPLDMSKWETVTVEELLTDLKADVVKDMAYLEWYDDSYYYRGDIVAHDGYIWVCKVDEATYGTFSRSDWKKTYVERWGRDLFFDISSQEMTFSDSEYTLPYSKGDVVYRYYPHPSNDGFQMRFYVAKADYPNGVTEYVASQWDEYYSLSEVVDALNKETNKSVDEALVEGTASGTIASFTDGSTLPMKKLEVAIEPVQDLHGYDNPWVGGSGKNKLQVTATSQTVGGITFTVNSDGTINVNGTATQNITLELSRKSKNGTPLPQGDLIMNGCPSGGSTSSYYLTCWRTNSGNANDVGEGRQFSYQSDWDFVVSLVILSGTTCNNLVFKPMIRLASVSDSTFEPYSNICPISGWDEVDITRAGKNLFDKTTITENKIINNNTGEETTSYGRFSSDYIKVNPSTNYYASNVIKSAQWYCAFYYDKNKNYLSCGELSSTGDTASGVLTTPSNCNYVRLVGLTTYKDDVSFVVGNTETSYEPYNGQTYTIDLDGTRYGGKLDVVSGVLTVDRVMVDMGDLYWSYDSGASLFTASIQGIKSGTYTDTNLISSIYPVKPMSYSQFDYGMRYNSATSLGVKNSAYTDATTFKTAMSGVQLVYELATPQTIQLTPTEVKSLLATNNVFADTGDILDATYVRNANITINDLIRRIENLENA